MLGGSEGRPRTDACLSVLSKYRRGRALDAVNEHYILLVSVEGQSFGLPFFVLVYFAEDRQAWPGQHG